MRLLPYLGALCVCAITACSQTPHTPTDPKSTAGLERSETLVTEDGSLRIEETRVGGVIKRIRVFPKDGQAPYDIDPVTRQRIWKIAEF
ncbi:hypothetical protein [Rhodoferax sp.]|uniref:hypothetical protein n=1 Tax=Rhodoferax sp. TaxID=50421 RepID=UPI0027515A89|nr:hypothetical protein [Rhodoferax sp.]